MVPLMFEEKKLWFPYLHRVQAVNSYTHYLKLFGEKRENNETFVQLEKFFDYGKFIITILWFYSQMAQWESQRLYFHVGVRAK